MSQNAINAHNGAQVTITKSKISNFPVAIGMGHSNTRVTVLRCELLDCILGVDVQNSSVSVLECILGVEDVARVLKNTSGVVEFKGNTICQPSIQVDRISKPVIHDFENLDVQFHQPEISQSSRKTQSKFTEQTSQLLSEPGFGTKSPLSAHEALLRVMNLDFKQCQHCGATENCSKSDFKLKFCSRCHRVCYCSKECQTADWKDHKFGCVSRN